MRFQKVKYKLINKDTGAFCWLSKHPQTAEEALYPAPKNWDKAEKSLKRSTKTYGVYQELSKNLEFTKQGAQFLRQGYIARDIEARFTLEEYRFHPQTEAEYLHSVGVFDFSEYSYKDGTVSIPFKTGGLDAIVRAYLSEKFQLDRLNAVNGEEIDALETKLVALTTREIFLVSELETEPNRQIINNLGAAFSMAVVPNITAVSNSDQENIVNTFDDDEQYWLSGGEASETTAEITQLFYFNSNQAKTIKIHLRFKIRSGKAGLNTTEYGGRFYRYNYDGNTLSYVDATTFLDLGYQSKDDWVEFDQVLEFDLEVGDCLRLGFIAAYGDGNGNASNSYFSIDYINMTITEDSTREDSQTQAVLMHEIGEKLLQILTGEKGRFYSDFYGRQDIGYAQDGEYSRTAITLGFWVRQFFEEKMEISLQDFLDASNAVHNTGYSIEVNGDDEKLILEDMKYFFQTATTIKIPNQVSKLERKAAKEFSHPRLAFGFKNPNADSNNSLYEEAFGLDEYNTMTGYTAPITRTETKYEKISPVRADSYGKEFAARKPKMNYPEEDTRYDRELMFLDLKVGPGEALEERTWSDDFEQAPENIYSPDTATNLRLTPYRINRRHEWFYGAGIYKQPDGSVVFSNKVGNELMTTKIAGEEAKAENVSTPVIDLERPRFVNQWITFEHPVDFDLNEQINGKTLIGGRLVPNYFGRVEFINDEGQKEHGYLFQLQPEGPGKWKILKAL